MSTKSLKRNMAINQKINIVEISRVANNLKSKETKTSYGTQQEEVATFAQRTLREPVDRTVFEKDKKENQMVSLAKSSSKYNKNISLRDDILRTIAKSNPRFNVVLKVI